MGQFLCLPLVFIKYRKLGREVDLEETLLPPTQVPLGLHLIPATVLRKLNITKQ